MKNLKSILNEYKPSEEGVMGPSRRTLQREQLRIDLLAVSDKNKSFFYIGTGMLVVLFILALILVWLWHTNTALITAIFAATGISFTGIISKMFAYWKEKTKIDMLLALLGGTDDEETLKTVIGILADRL